MREEQVIAKLQSFVNTMVKDKAVVTVLEAGCGSCSHLHFEKDVFMVGIDISERQLQKHTGLNEKILGDIQYYDYPPSSFDVIVCWDVLEHLREPELSLHRFAIAVKEGGLVILKAPNVCSLKGIVTKCLPYSLHVLAYRYMFGKKRLAEHDMKPFKTYLRSSTAPAALSRFASTYGLHVVYFDAYDVETSNWLEQKKITHALYKTLKACFEFVSLGEVNDSEFVIVLRKATAKTEFSRRAFERRRDARLGAFLPDDGAGIQIAGQNNAASRVARALRRDKKHPTIGSP